MYNFTKSTPIRKYCSLFKFISINYNCNIFQNPYEKWNAFNGIGNRTQDPLIVSLSYAAYL